MRRPYYLDNPVIDQSPERRFYKYQFNWPQIRLKYRPRKAAALKRFDHIRKSAIDQGNVVKQYRSGESKYYPFRTERFYHANNAWYFLIRGGSAKGPYPQKQLAENALREYIELQNRYRQSPAGQL